MVVIELAEGHFCPDVFNDGYLNMSVLLLKKGNEGATDQVFMVRSFGDFAIMANNATRKGATGDESLTLQIERGVSFDTPLLEFPGTTCPYS